MIKDNKRKLRIIDAAIEVLKENKVEDATMRKIAAKAGLTTGALYHHYKNKDEILFEVIEQSLHFSHKISSTAEVEGAFKDKDQLLNEIISKVTIRLSKSDEQKLYILLLSDVIANDSEIKEKYKKSYTRILENVANLFGKAFGVENEEYKKNVASILVAAVDGMAFQQALEVLPDNQEKIIETFTTFFTESIPKYLKDHLNQ